MVNAGCCCLRMCASACLFCGVESRVSASRTSNQQQQQHSRTHTAGGVSASRADASYVCVRCGRMLAGARSTTHCAASGPGYCDGNCKLICLHPLAARCRANERPASGGLSGCEQLYVYGSGEAEAVEVNCSADKRVIGASPRHAADARWKIQDIVSSQRPCAIITSRSPVVCQ